MSYDHYLGKSSEKFGKLYIASTGQFYNIREVENIIKAFEFLKNHLDIKFEIIENRCFIILNFDRFQARLEVAKQEFDILMEAFKMSKQLSPLEALEYLDDIAHGRKMKYDPHELKKIVEKALEYHQIKVVFFDLTMPILLNFKVKNSLDLRRRLKALEIIIEHKLLNYVLKNKKCAEMYRLQEDDLKFLEEVSENGNSKD